jgi:hypothetical protein
VTELDFTTAERDKERERARERERERTSFGRGVYWRIYWSLRGFCARREIGVARSSAGRLLRTRS